MGFSIAWIAVRDKPKAVVHAELGLRETGAQEAESDWPIAGVELPGGWYLLFLNDLLHPFTEEAVLSKLSQGCLAVTCQVEEHVMASTAVAYRGGVKQWGVTHESDQGPRHLVERGDLPSHYAGIKKRLLNEQDVGDAEAHGVDYVWDMPVTLAHEVVGFRHDAVQLKAGGEPIFCELVDAADAER